MKLQIIIIVLISLQSIVSCKKDETVISWIPYPISGLNQFDAKVLAIDSFDKKWIGTNTGLISFDGKNWVAYTERNSITSIAIDSRNHIWIGSGHYSAESTLGISVYDGNSISTRLSNYSVNSIAIDGNGIKWIGTNNGLIKYDGNTSTVYNEGISVSSIAIDPAGTKWIGTYRGFLKFDNNVWTTLLENSNINFVTIDSYNNKWIGFLLLGVKEYSNGVWTDYNRNNGLINDCVYSILIDQEGNKWFGTYDGISKFNGKEWTTYLKGIPIYSIAIDSQKNIWALSSKTLYKYNAN